MSGHLLLRGLRIRTRPRSNKRRRNPSPMRCLSADNSDQFWDEEKSQVGPKRNVLAGKELAAAAAQGKGGCAGWDLRIDRAIFVRPSLTEPPEILNLLLFSSFSAPPPPPPSPPSPPSLPQAPAGEKWRRVCRLIDPQPPRPPPPNEKPLFCRHRCCEGRASSRPMGANIFSSPNHPLHPLD